MIKKRLNFAIVAATAVLSFSAGPVAAQEVDIAASCSAAPEGCAALVLAQIEALKTAGLSGETLDTAIAQIAASVYRAAQINPSPVVVNALASALNSAASSMSNPAAASGVLQAASVVASGAAASTQPTAFGLSAPEVTLDTTGLPASPT
ncbi:hypothetical protein [Celeribacter sp.]|uniref:hypothetical protein n=1 Tax=Celeribacter sp. TaxID=1890673 RepID=UPI003A9373B5